MGEPLPPDHQRVSNVRQVQLPMSGQVVLQPTRHGIQGRCGAGREENQLLRTRGPRPHLRWRLLQHDVGVRPSHSERTHPCTPGRAVGRPFDESRVDEEGARFQSEPRIWRTVVEARRELLKVQGQGGLDEPGGASRVHDVPHIGLDGAQRTEPDVVRAASERLREGGQLDGVAEGRCGAVGLHVANASGLEPGHVLRCFDDVRLTIHARRREAGFERAVVVDRRALYHAVDRIPIGQGIFESLEQH